MKTQLPDTYRGIEDAELIERILAAKKKYGDELVILAHHYQRKSIVELGDYKGDSYGLCVEAANSKKAKYIVFCGVGFMAESAAILCRSDQKVFHPDQDAGCPMADMAEVKEVRDAWDAIAKVADVSKIVPITYMNSTGAIKAFCGARGGCVVTSSNAANGFKWAFERGEKIFFFPDEHLGTNTAHKLGIPPDQVAVWDPKMDNGGLENDKIKSAKVILWKGYCHVHTNFKTEHIIEARKKYPGVKIVVHPECPREVVELADANGSTGFIIKYVENSPPGSIIAIGTEINLIGRLAEIHKDKQIFELVRSFCPNMYKINLNKLCFTLENIPNANVVKVDDSIAIDARKALERMLEIK